jgi:hypothetical protein
VRANFGIVCLAQRSLSPLGETFARMVREADGELVAWEEKSAGKLFAQHRAHPARRAS